MRRGCGGSSEANVYHAYVPLFGPSSPWRTKASPPTLVGGDASVVAWPWHWFFSLPLPWAGGPSIKLPLRALFAVRCVFSWLFGCRYSVGSSVVAIQFWLFDCRYSVIACSNPFAD